jgi:hypothetical protein
MEVLSVSQGLQEMKSAINFSTTYGVVVEIRTGNFHRTTLLCRDYISLLIYSSCHSNRKATP